MTIPPSEATESLGILRRSVLALLALGLAGTGAELVLLRHYEDAWQWAPLVLIAVGLAVLAWHAVRPGAASVRALRVAMILLAASGLVGLALHFRSNREFQMELDSSLAGWALVWKVMQSKAPPSLAPGTLTQLGLLGLVATFRHPALSRPSTRTGG
jgi:hypothetical protein